MTAALIGLILGTGILGTGLIAVLPKQQPVRVAANRK